MKNILLSTALFIGLATSATAQNAPTVDWGGFYLGGSVNNTGGTQDYFNTNASYDLDSASSMGAFVGYNIQRSRMVYGLEFAVTGSGTGISPIGFLSEDHGNLIDIKARAGVAVNKALYYGVLGYSKTSFNNNVDAAKTLDGISYGLGVDYMVSNNLFIGSELLVRNLSGPGNSTQPLQTRETNAKTFSIRVGWKF